jgi:predicted Zn-dependent protease
MAERNEIDNQIYQMTLNASARALSANRPVEAIEVLKSLHTEYPHDPDIAINMGGALILQRKWNQAVRVLLPAARENTQNAMLWVNLAAAYLGSLETSGPKQQQRAITAYEQALRADPKAPNVHYHLGLIYKEQGNLTQASALFQRALEINPKDKDAQRWLDRLSELIVAAAQASTPDAPPPADESE